MSEDKKGNNQSQVEMFKGAAKAYTNGAAAPVENSGSDTGANSAPVQILHGTPVQSFPRSKFDRVSPNDPDASGQKQPLSQYQEPRSLYFKTLNEISDVLMQVLDGSEFKVYFRLYRLSHGYKQTTCFVGHMALARSCNLSLRTINYILSRLVALGLVRILEVHNSPEKKGTLYEVFTSLPEESAAGGHQCKVCTGAEFAPIKEKEIDSDKKENHHQRQVMKIFTELTGKPWTKADTASYQKVAEVPLEKLEFLMRRIQQRASAPIGSFAFFAASVQNELAAPASAQAAAGAGSAAGLKKKYQKFAAEIRAAYVGGALSVSDLIYKLKGRCLRDGVPWNDDLANEVLAK
jgi:hypothetical protein